MDEVVRKHLSVIIAITLLGLVTGYLAMTFVRDNAAVMNANSFALWVFLVPCVFILVCSFAIAATARQIGRQLYLVVLVVSLICGIISMIMASGWLSDPEISALLLANSPEETVITPILQSPITILRDIAAFVVLPTVGCIFGAWVGSRVHPMTTDGTENKKSSKKKK